MTKTFTLSEAQVLLPVLESLLQRAKDGEARANASQAETQALQHRIFLMGGLRVDVAAATGRRAEFEKASQESKDALAEIEAIGVRVQDFDGGLLDFPCVADGKTVLLCWRLGEPTILHWHSEEDGAEKRRPLETLFGRSSPSERPN